jgi:hypothetical protein
MVAAIVFIVMVASVLRAALGGGRSRRHRRGEVAIEDSGENARLREEVSLLKERLAVLERITVEKENSLEREIEALRDR